MGQWIGAFRESPGQGCAWAGNLAVCIAGVGVVAGVLSGNPLVETFAKAAVGGVLSFLLLFATWALLGLWYTVEIYEHGLVGPGHWKPRVSITWAEIAEVGELSDNGLQYVTLERKGPGPAVHIPKGLLQRDEFCRLLLAYAGAESPMASALAPAAQRGASADL